MKGGEQGKHSLKKGKLWRFFAAITVATQIVACGSVLDALPGAGKSGSNGGGSSLAPTQAVGTLSGVVKDALVRNATVNVYAWAGEKGELLGSGTTDSRGRYSLTLQVRSQSVLLEAVGGEYEEEATGKVVAVDADQALYALQNYTSGQPLSTTITYYTTLATGLAENLVRLGVKPPDAVDEANARLRKIIGFDTRTVRPTDILDPDSVSVPELEYGFATAALSSLTERASLLNDSEPHRIFTSVRFIQAAYDDVRADGVLNGKGSNGDVVFGRIRLSSQIYRHELALHILRIANNKTANRTGRGPAEMFDLAKRLNDSTDRIFGGDPVIPIDRDKPNVSALVAEEFPNLPNNAVVFGGLNLTAMVMAFPGAAKAELLLDDRVIGTALDPENPSVRLETFTSSISEGRHVLKFRVTDIVGAIGESPPLDVNVSNRQTAIENVSIADQFIGMQTPVTALVVDPALPRRIQYSVRPRGATAFTPVATITASGPEIMLQPSASIDPRQLNLADGEATLKIEVTNSVGSVFMREVAFVVDQQRPSVVALAAILGGAPMPGRYFDEDVGAPCAPTLPAESAGPCVFYARGSFDISTQVIDNSAIDRVALTVDGVDVGQPLVPLGIEPNVSSTATIDPRSLGSRVGGAEKTAAVVAVDKANNMAIASQKIVFDTTAPTVSDFQITAVAGDDGSIVLDGDPVIVKGPVNISAQVADEFGVASAQLTLNEAGIGGPVLNQGSLATIPPLQFDTLRSAPDGVNVISAVATDRAGNQMVAANSRSFVVDNTAPVITLTRLSFARERCQLEGSVSDARFDSLVFTGDSGFQATIPPDGTGAFVIRLGGSGDFMLAARDTLGNMIARNFSVIRTPPEFLPGQGGGAIVRPGTCALQENGVVVFQILEIG